MTLRAFSISALAILLGTVAVPVAAQEGCYYKGELYPHGTRVGGFVCDDGEWVAG